MSKKRVIISSIAGTLAITTALSFIGFSKTKLKAPPYTGHIISSNFDDYTEDDYFYIASTETESLIADNSNFETTGSKTTNDDNNDIGITEKNDKDNTEQTYEAFLAQINEIVTSKNFDDETQKIIIESYNLMYENYNNTYEAYKMSGIPTREEYIQKQFIDTIKKNLDKVTIYNDSDNVDLIIFDNAGAYYNPSDKSMKMLNKRNFHELCVLFLHELTHAYQKAFLTSEVASKIRTENRALWYILTEGEADLSDTIVSETIQKKGNNVIEDNQTDCHYNIYGKTADKKYNLLYRFYSMLSHLSGYEAMQDLKQTGEIASIITTINEKYNTDSTEFINKCQALALHIYEEEEDAEFISESIEYIDNFYLNCLSTEAEKISSKEEAIDMFNYYRYYKLQEQTKYAISNEDGNRDLTEEKYDFGIVEDKLFDKCMEYDAFDIFKEDSELCRKAFDAILRIDSSNSMTTLEPITLSGRNYMLLEDEGKIVLYYDEHAIYYDLDGGDKERKFLEFVEEKGTDSFISDNSSKVK